MGGVTQVSSKIIILEVSVRLSFQSLPSFLGIKNIWQNAPKLRQEVC